MFAGTYVRLVRQMNNKLSHSSIAPFHKISFLARAATMRLPSRSGSGKSEAVITWIVISIVIGIAVLFVVLLMSWLANKD